MDYFVEVEGKRHKLPARTAAMDERIDLVQNIQSRINSGEITRREGRREQYNLVSDCMGRTLPPLEEMDMGDLEVAVAEIIAAYQRPANQARIEMVMSDLREVMDRPELKELASYQKMSKVKVRKK